MFSRSRVHPVMLASVLAPFWFFSATSAPGIGQTPLLDSHGDPLPPGAMLRIGTTRLRHGDFISKVAFTSDGKTLVSCAWDGTLRSWDVSTGKELHCFKAHKRAVMSFTISKDGKTLASISQDFTIRLWDLRAGKELRKLDAPRGAYYDLAFSPDEQLLASCGQHIRIWETKNYQVIREFEKEMKWIYCLTFSPDGKKLVTGDKMGVLCFWETGSWKELRRLKAHTQGVWSLAFSPNGKFLVSSGDDGRLSLRNPETGEEIRPLCKQDPRRCSPIAFTPDSKTVAWSWGAEGIIHQLETATGKEVGQMKTLPYGIDALAFSPDGKLLASASKCTIRLWDVQSSKEINPFTSPQNPVSALVFCANDTMLAGSQWGDGIDYWDSHNGKALRQITGYPVGRNFLLESQNGQKCVSRDGDGCVSIWDLTQAKISQRFPINEDCAPVAVSPDGKILAIENLILQKGRVYDIQSRKELGCIGTVSETIFLPDGQSLMLHFPDGKFARWNIAAGKIVSWLAGDYTHDRGMAVSADGKSFVSAGTMDDVVHRWDLITGEQLSPLDSDQKSVACMAFSPDGRTLASGGRDGSIWLWEMRTGRRRLVLRGHQGPVLSLTFSRDGRRLASGSKDTTVLVWDLTTGVSMERPKEFTAAQLDGYWRDLAGEDAAKAYQAIWLLASASKQSLPFLKARLRPLPIPDAKRMVQLLVDLDSEDFQIRTAAYAELEKLGESASAPLRATAAKPPSLEVRLRVKELQDKLRAERKAPPPERIRSLRAVEVLEDIGSSEACQILKDLANGAPEAQLTCEAKASLARIAKRAKHSH